MHRKSAIRPTMAVTWTPYCIIARSGGCFLHCSDLIYTNFLKVSPIHKPLTLHSSCDTMPKARITFTVVKSAERWRCVLGWGRLLLKLLSQTGNCFPRPRETPRVGTVMQNMAKIMFLPLALRIWVRYLNFNSLETRHMFIFGWKWAALYEWCHLWTAPKQLSIKKLGSYLWYLSFFDEEEVYIRPWHGMLLVVSPRMVWILRHWHWHLTGLLVETHFDWHFCWLLCTWLFTQPDLLFEMLV